MKSSLKKNKLSTSDKVSGVLGTVVNHLASYVTLWAQIVEVTDAASTGVATAAQLGTQVMTTSAFAAAGTATTNTAVSAMLIGSFKARSIAIAEAAGKAAGEAAGEAVVKTVTVGTAKESVKAMTLVAARPVAETAANAVMKKKAVQISATATKIAAKSAGQSTGAAVAKVITSLPLLNFGLVALVTYMTYKAGKDLACGSSEENLLRNKIKELKDEANKIVTDIYNYSVEQIKHPQEQIKQLQEQIKLLQEQIKHPQEQIKQLQEQIKLPQEQIKLPCIDLPFP